MSELECESRIILRIQSFACNLTGRNHATRSFLFMIQSHRRLHFFPNSLDIFRGRLPFFLILIPGLTHQNR
ncbi:MAG: hypothetical protein ACK2UW_20820, partial [Anaerolineales bacterium]